MNNQDGFTLLEIMIALFIFAILAITVSFGFHQIVTINEHVQKKMHRWNQIVLAFSMMQSDLNQMVPRPIENGDGQKMASFVNNIISVEFTTDVFNPSIKKGDSDLRRVSYTYSSGSLEKLTWPVLDRAKQTKPISKVILRGIDYVKFTNYQRTNKPNALPRAVAVDIDLRNIGHIKRVFMVTGNTK